MNERRRVTPLSKTLRNDGPNAAGWWPSRSDQLLMLAGNAKQYDFWCREWGIDPRTEAVYVHSLRELHESRSGVHYAVAGTFWEDPPRDASDILARLELLDAKALQP